MKMMTPVLRCRLPFFIVLWLLEPTWLEAFTVLDRPATLSLCRRKIVRTASALDNSNNDINHDNKCDNNRRNFLFQSSAAATLFITSFFPREAAQAAGLVQFPCRKPLGNTYHFMRVGETLLEEQDIWSTNPLFLTNREAALSPKGVEQVEAVCRYLKDHHIELTAGRYSLAASAMDAATIIIRELKLGRDRLIPEYTFMDPRAVGQWDMLNGHDTESAVWAMDALEAGSSGIGARPPPNEDSTPNETLEDQAVRLRQLLSVLETQYSGDSILLIFPDGTGPALLSALIGGIPMNRVHELEYEPGEVRLDVTMASTVSLFREKELNNTAYLERIEAGKEQLAKLRAMGDDVDLIDRKDEMYEQERLEMEREQRIREQVRIERRLAEQQKRDLRKRQMDEELALKYGNNSNTGNSLVGAAAGIVTVATIGAVAVGVATSSGKPTEDTNAVERTTPPSPSSSMNGDNEPPEVDERGPPQDLSKTLKQDGLAAAIAASTRTRFPGTSTNGDDSELYSSDLKNGRSDANPYISAKSAMEEYLDQDDGGEDWLQVLSEILDDKTDDDDAPERGGNETTR